MTHAEVAALSGSQRAQTSPSGREVAIVLLASGAIGFLFGALNATWQDALEPAQVLAGLVRYPVSTPVFVYSIKTWTIIHQILALAFQWGCSERTLAIALSGMTGMMSLQALAVFVLALCGDVTWAVVSSFFLLISNATLGGVTYPVLLMGAPHTYGIVGLSYGLLTIALLGAGRVRAGAVMLGFAPAVHLTLGLLCLFAVGLAFVIERRSAGRWIGSVWPYLVAGLAAALASALIQFMRHDIDLRQTAAGLRASAAFTHYWGQDHRRPFEIFGRGMLFVWASLVLSLCWLGPFRDDVPVPARFMLKILVAAALAGTVLSISYWLPPALVPNVLYALMPSRLLNLHVMTCMALIVGLAWRYRDDVWIQALLAAIVVGCSASAMANGQSAYSARLAIGVGGPALIALAGLRWLGIGTGAAPARVLHSLRRATLLAPAAALTFAILLSMQRVDDDMWGDRSNDVVYAAAASRAGLLLTAADIHRVQLHTRRPVLFDGGALDGLPYIPEAAGQVDTILRRVYGIDTFHDIPSNKDVGGLGPDTSLALWEGRTAAEWEHLAREFDFTDILTYSEWRLHLPVITRSSDYILYRVR